MPCPTPTPRAVQRRGSLAVLLAAIWGWPAVAWDASALQAAAQRQGARAVAALAPLQALLGAARTTSEPERLALVNRFFNERIAFRPDIEVWGVEDHWATPMEMLGRGHGDCEDYAIAKYATLRASGIAAARLRLVYVRATLSDPRGSSAQPHMVLAYHGPTGQDPLILDNLRDEILPASQRPDLMPVFSFNSEGLWQGAGETRAGDPLVRLSPWRDVWARTQAEGFR